MALRVHLNKIGIEGVLKKKKMAENHWFKLNTYRKDKKGEKILEDQCSGKDLM